MPDHTDTAIAIAKEIAKAISEATKIVHVWIRDDTGLSPLISPDGIQVLAAIIVKGRRGSGEEEKLWKCGQCLEEFPVEIMQTSKSHGFMPLCPDCIKICDDQPSEDKDADQD